MNTSNNGNETYRVYPVGYVRASESGFALDILPEFRPALKGLDQFSHVKVYWWGDKSDTPAARSTMQADLPYAEGVTAGVFACRAEYRPNPILETISAIIYVNVDDGLVVVPWIDAFDGTPVLDLKPYIPISDRVRDFKVAGWLSDLPDWMEDAAEFFAEHEDFFD
jgi:tRNA (Thr-GGU) A37 N-methylase